MGTHAVPVCCAAQFVVYPACIPTMSLACIPTMYLAGNCSVVGGMEGWSCWDLVIICMLFYKNFTSKRMLGA